MKFIATLFIVGLSIVAISQTEPKLKFNTLTIENNSIPYGSDFTFEFPFKNTSKEFVKIEDVKRSCGCTTPYFPSDSIKPGKKEKIIAKYDTKRVGDFTKTLTVMVKGSEPILLTIKGKVLPETNPSITAPVKKD